MSKSEVKIVLWFIGFMYAMVMLVCAVLHYKPPRHINWYYGYRTSRASRNIENWRYANALAPKVLFIVSQVAVFLALTALYWLHRKVSLDVMFLILVGLFAFFPIIVVPVVEYKLRKFEEKQKMGSS